MEKKNNTNQRRSQEFDWGGGINCTISNLPWVKETKQPRKKIKVD